MDEAQKSVEVLQAKHRESLGEIRAQSEKARHASTLADQYEDELRAARGQLEEEQRSQLDLQVRLKPRMMTISFCSFTHPRNSLPKQQSCQLLDQRTTSEKLLRSRA